MRAMLIEDDPATRACVVVALLGAGFDVTVAHDPSAAKVALRHGTWDVLVLAERVEGRLTHDVALLAELRNPRLGTILVSERTGADADELFELLPSLHALLGRGTPARTLAGLALAAARCQGGAPDEAPEGVVIGTVPAPALSRPPTVRTMPPPVRARPVVSASPWVGVPRQAGASLSLAMGQATEAAPTYDLPAARDENAAEWAASPRRLHIA